MIELPFWLFMCAICFWAGIIVQRKQTIKWKFRYRAMRKNYLDNKNELFKYISSTTYKRSNGTKP